MNRVERTARARNKIDRRPRQSYDQNTNDKDAEDEKDFYEIHKKECKECD